MDKWPACRVCGGETRPTFIGGEHRMFNCKVCETAFVSPVPPDEYLKSFYDKFHRSSEQGGSYDEEIEDRMRSDFPAKLRLVQRHVGSPRRLLDIGCGKGFFVRDCVDAGIKAEGIDLSASAIEFARREHKAIFYQGEIGQLKKKLTGYDVATFWATIEHLGDPIRALKDIWETLDFGGHLFLDTGIANDWLDKWLPGHVQWYDPPQHLFVFSEKGIRMMLKDAGFEVLQVDTCFERSNTRRIVKQIRNGIAALGVRTIWSLAGLNTGPFPFTRFPMGNLMSVVAKKN